MLDAAIERLDPKQRDANQTLTARARRADAVATPVAERFAARPVATLARRAGRRARLAALAPRAPARRRARAARARGS